MGLRKAGSFCDAVNRFPIVKPLFPIKESRVDRLSVTLSNHSFLWASVMGRPEPMTPPHFWPGREMTRCYLAILGDTSPRTGVNSTNRPADFIGSFWLQFDIGKWRCTIFPQSVAFIAVQCRSILSEGLQETCTEIGIGVSV